MKKTIIIIIISLLVTAGTFVLSKYHNRDKMMTQMNKDIQDYYYISCPNGNELDIKQKSSNEYQYSILSYPFSTTEYTNKFTFRLKVSLDQKFIFEKIGLLTGTSGVNANTDFPNCLIKENDSSQYQRFFFSPRQKKIMMFQQSLAKAKYMYHSRMQSIHQIYHL